MQCIRLVVMRKLGYDVLVKQFGCAKHYQSASLYT